jgi:O-antigen ligase
MKGVVGNRGAMMAVKAGVAASTIFLAEKMWKRGNRAGAIATMLIVNGVTAAVVANNYKVASTLR